MSWFYLLLPFVLPLYLIRFRVFGFPSTALEVYLVILLASFTLSYGWSGWRTAWQQLGAWRYLAIAWIIATIIAVFASPSVWTGFGLWRAYVLEPLLVFITLFVALERVDVRRRFVRSLFLICWIVVAWAVGQFVTGKGIPHPWDVSITAGRRATGPYPFPNALALFVTPIAALAFGEWVKHPRRYFALATWFICLLGIVLARSDGGLITLALVTALMLCTKRWGRALVATGALLGAMALAVLPQWRATIWHELSFQGWSGKVRLIMWHETWTMLKDHWFFGAGFGGYPRVFYVYHTARFIEIFQYPHNILFNFWSETGLFGVAAFLGILGRWIKQIWVTSPHLSLRRRGREEVVVALAPLLAILIHGLVDVPYFKNDLAIVFWILIFLTTAAPIALDEKKES